MHYLNEFVSFLIESNNNLSPYVLWHRILGHSSQDRMNYSLYCMLKEI